MTGREKSSEAEAHHSTLPAEADSGEDITELCAELRRERAKQKPITTSEILCWRHEGHPH